MKLFMTIIYILLVGQAGFYFGLCLPRDWFCEDSFPYRSFAWEKDGQIYNLIKIKSWKSRVPDMSAITKLLFPKKIQKNITSLEIEKLIKESCVAEFIHYFLCIFAVGVYRIWRGKIGFLMALIYALGNLVFVAIQRYNRPHYISLREKLLVREERRAHALLS